MGMSHDVEEAVAEGATMVWSAPPSSVSEHGGRFDGK